MAQALDFADLVPSSQQAPASQQTQTATPDVDLIGANGPPAEATSTASEPAEDPWVTGALGIVDHLERSDAAAAAQSRRTGQSITADQVISPAGAIGRFQVEPGTATQYGYDPSKLGTAAYNRQVAGTVLSALRDRYTDDQGNTDWGRVLIGYNAGPGVADKWDGDPTHLPKQTQDYLHRGEQFLGTPGAFTGQKPGNAMDFADLLPSSNAPNFDTSHAKGMVKPGNLDPWNRPVLHNQDGSYSTTSSISVGTDAGEVLIPTVIDGKRYSNKDAIAHFQSTGENFGTFKTPDAADTFATALHNAQASQYDSHGNLLPKSNALDFADLVPKSNLPKPTQPEDSFMGALAHAATNAWPSFQAEWGSMVQSGAEKAQGSAPWWMPLTSGATPDEKAKLQKTAQWASDLRTTAETEIKANLPNVAPGSAKDMAYQAATGVIQLMPIIAASAATKDPFLAGALIGEQSYAQQYGQSRDQSRNAAQANMDATFSGITNGALSALPLGIIMKPGQTFLGKMIKGAASFGAISVIGEAMQIGYDTGILNEKMTVAQAMDRLKQAGITGTLQGAFLSGGHAGLDVAVNHLRGTPAAAHEAAAIPGTTVDVNGKRVEPKPLKTPAPAAGVPPTTAIHEFAGEPQETAPVRPLTEQATAAEGGKQIVSQNTKVPEPAEPQTEAGAALDAQFPKVPRGTRGEETEPQENVRAALSESHVPEERPSGPKINAHTIDQEHDDEITRLETEGIVSANKPKGGVLVDFHDLVPTPRDQISRGNIDRRDVAPDIAVTATGRKVPVQYAVVEADHLVPSQTPDGNPNPLYPQELQPRDRSRITSAAQISDIAQNLNPALLDKIPMASHGAPIISPDGIVESGNGRTLAVQQAYGNGLDTAEGYRAYLKAQGYPVDGLRKPMLVRVRTGEMTPDERQAFTREANQSGTMALSATERAMGDAAGLPDSVLPLYRGGEVESAENRPFVRAFMNAVVDPADHGAMISPDGTLSQDAIRRVRAALLAKAYGDADLVAKIVESGDENIRAIGGALTDVAADWAKMRAAARGGEIPPAMDQTTNLINAVRIVRHARANDRNVAEYVGQGDIFSGESITPETEAFLQLMFRNEGDRSKDWTRPVGRDKLAESLRFYLGEAIRAGSGADLLGDEAPTPLRILQLAKARQYPPIETGPGLFTQGQTRPGGNAAEGGPAGARPQGAPAAVPPSVPAPRPGSRALGVNGSGDPVFEDARGVRSYVRNGIRVEEPVGIVPTQGGLAIAVPTTHDPDFSPVAAAAPAPTNAEVAPPAHRLADAIAARLLNNAGEPFAAKELYEMAEAIYGGSLASGAIPREDLYDALELGVNKYVAGLPRQFDPATDNVDMAVIAAQRLANLKDRLPTQSIRAGEKESKQQYSTPPDYSFAATWAANLDPSDRVLEPSAGTGSFVVDAMNAGVDKVWVNELSERRADMLRTLAPDGVFTENAEHIDALLPTVDPTVVLMNPPFSVSPGMEGTRVIEAGSRHVEAALNKLHDGGRLIAIVGKGMSPDAPRFRDWWRKIAAQYDIRANIGVDGSIYRKYGTTFDTRLLVIDKNAPSGRAPVVAEVKTAAEIVEALKDVRSDRKPISTEFGGAPVGLGGPRPGAAAAPLPSQPGPLGTGETGRPAPGEGNRPASGGPRGTGGPLAGGEGSRPGVPVAAPEPVGPGDVGANQHAPVGASPMSQSPAGGGGGAGDGIVPDGSGARDDPGITPAPATVRAEQVAASTPTLHDAPITDAIYENYKAVSTIDGAKEHPGALVESAAMGSVDAPQLDYKPKIPDVLIKEGALSDAQLEAIARAGASHEQILPASGDDPERRRGFFIGDGTGVGKGREVAGIILDNMMQGRTKHIWVSENGDLINDARRDWKGMRRDPKEIVGLNSFKPGDPIKHPHGILFTSYDTLRSAETTKGAAVPQFDETGRRTDNRGKSRVDQIVDWAGKDFGGVIAFDESHNLGNSEDSKGSRGVKQAAAKALAGVELQRKLPNARVVYVSATGATEVSNLSYADRLGLWGRGTAFADKKDFVSKIGAGGVAAMELVARDMKAMGQYTARNLSFDGVDYDRLEHRLAPPQREIYDKLADAWQIVLKNFHAAMAASGITEAKPDGTVNNKNAQAKSGILSQFWSTHQRFFNQIVTGMQMPTVLKGVERDIAEGRQAVLQLVNTNEASQTRALNKLEDDADLEDLDLSPLDQLTQMVDKLYPTQRYEDYVDESGNKRSRPVVDGEGNPVHDPRLLAAKERLLTELGALKVPDGPLEMLLNHFGVDQVAEITGRKQRVVNKLDDNGQMKKTVEKRSAADNITDASLFQEGKKPILVFSQKGGTGRSYHADVNSASADARRSHYLVQGGWRADKAVQGFGRTHRTNQASAPIFHLVTTDIEGQKRFISSIARRLAQLGALTKGERRTGDQGLFGMRDNLESSEATRALTQLYHDSAAGSIDGVGIHDLEDQMGLKLIDPSTGTLFQKLPPITQFLNRLLSLRLEMQNKVFNAFSQRMDDVIDRSAAAGTLDTGVETYRADTINKISDNLVHTDKTTGATTRHAQFEIGRRNRVTDFDTLSAGGSYLTRNKPPIGFIRSLRGNKVFALSEATAHTDENGAVIDQVRLADPTSYQYLDKDKLSDPRYWQPVKPDDARADWEKQIATTPEFDKSELHMITGAVLPIWDRLTGSPKVYRLQTDAGERLLGRVVPNDSINDVLAKLGAKGVEVHATPQEIGARVLSGEQAELSNGWKIKRSTVSGEVRLELIGPDMAYLKQLEQDGVFTERIDWKTRFFIPTNEETRDVISRIVADRPVTKLFRPSKAQAAYHGSPYDFDKFKNEAIGSGEGAQVYGHGHYFAGKRDVGEYYRKMLAHKAVDAKSAADRHGVPLMYEAVGAAYGRAMRGEDPDRAARQMQYQFPELRPVDVGKIADMFRDLQSSAKGKLYSVDLSPKDDEWLDHDKPLAEQSAKVKEGIAKLQEAGFTYAPGERGEESWTRAGGSTEGMYGRDLYDHLAKFNGGKANASEILRRAGISGLRYHDQMSRLAAAQAEAQAHEIEQGLPSWEKKIADIRADIERNKDNSHLLPRYFEARNEEIQGHEKHIADLRERLKDAKEAAAGATHNYVVFDPEHIKILSKEQRVAAQDWQVSTEALKRWFGKSKVVDDAGNPKPVYHGTMASFPAFDKTFRGAASGASDARLGFFFTDSPETANVFARDAHGEFHEGANIMPVYLRIENPAEVDYEGGLYGEDDLRKAIREAKRTGHDGLIVRNVGELGYSQDGPEVSTHYIAFDPKQIKSVLNRGTFDEKTARLSEQREATFGKRIGARDLGGKEELAPDTLGYRTAELTPAEKATHDAVMQLARRLVPGAETRMMRALEAIEPGDSQQRGKRILGSNYGPAYRRMIAWSMESPDAHGTMKHEAVHWLRQAGLIRPDEWKVLERAAIDGGWLDKHNIAARYPDLDRDERIEEAIAEEFGVWKRRDRSVPTGVHAVFRRIGEFLAQVGDHMRRVFGADATADNIFSRMNSGEMGARTQAEVRDQMRSKAQAAKAPEKEPDPVARGIYAAVDRALGAPLRRVGDRLSETLDRMPSSIHDLADAAKMGMTPMAAGEPKYRAWAKDFANALRASADEHDRVDKYLQKNFTPDEQRQMYDAMDTEGVSKRMGRAIPEGKGLDSLAPRLRAVTDELDKRRIETGRLAQKFGMLKRQMEDYVPRMGVIWFGGRATRPRGDGGVRSEIGKNLRTTTPQLLQRKYTEIENTEKAFQARFGEEAEIVHNIRALNLATRNLQQAIAGRALIEKLRADGDAMGKATVVEGERADPQHYFTIPGHPAFERWKPDFVNDGAKIVPRLDDQGNIVFKATPLWVAKEAEGPLRAVLSKDQSLWQRALLALKGKTMSLIMYSPAIHNQVIWGRAFPAAPMRLLLPKIYRGDDGWHYGIWLYVDGAAARRDDGLRQRAIKAGMDPIGRRYFNQDITAIAEGADSIEPGRSWTAQALSAVPGLFDPRAGLAVQTAVDRAGDFWHNTLLWDRVADLQMGLWKMMSESFANHGLPQGAADRVAAHFANRYAGALPMEAMGKAARAWANWLLFSRSFTLGNLAAFKDAAIGVPRDVQAQIQRDYGPKALDLAQGMARRKAMSLIIGDILASKISLVMGSMAVAAAVYATTGVWKYRGPDQNEPGEENRVFVGHAADGTAIYARLPVGKTGEDLQDWSTQPRNVLLRKLSPQARIALAVASNDKGFGRKLFDDNDKTLGGNFDALVKIAGKIVDAFLPIGEYEFLKNLITGEGDRTVNAAGAILPLTTGVTISHGAPGGEAQGEFLRARDENRFQIQEAMPAIRAQIKNGDIQGARAAMHALGMPPREQTFYIRTTLNPGMGMTPSEKRQLRQFGAPDVQQRVRQDLAH